VIFLLEGHAFPGYWRSEESRQAFVEGRSALVPTQGESYKTTAQYRWMEIKDGYDEIVQLARNRDLVPLETVWLTQHKGYWEARDAGLENLRSKIDFECMVDVKGARGKEVTPLPLTRGDS
jgi:hypothetical protein